MRPADGWQHRTSDFYGLEKFGIVKKHRKGEILTKVRPELERDVISFAYNVSEFSEKELDEFFNIIKSIDIEKYKKRGCEVRIRLYIQSDYAQIYFGLSENIISKVNALGVFLEVSIFSLGGEDY